MLATKSNPARCPTLRATTAAELMTANPVSLRALATASEARELFIARAISAAPVIDEAGRPVGVLSHTDLLIHAAVPGADDRTTVQDLMTPAVFSVSPGTPASDVIENLLALGVHHLFVVDPAGVLIGVISALDIVRHLRPSKPGHPCLEAG